MNIAMNMRVCALVNASMPSGGYDLFFTDLGDYFIVHVNTQMGEDIIEAAKFFESAEKSHLEELAEIEKKEKGHSSGMKSLLSRDIYRSFLTGLIIARVWDELNEDVWHAGTARMSARHAIALI